MARTSRSRWYLDGYDEGVFAAQVNLEEPGGMEEMREAVERDELGEIAGQVREHQVQMAGDISYEVDRPGGPTSAQMDLWEEGFYAGFEATVRHSLRRARKESPFPEMERAGRFAGRRPTDVHVKPYRRRA